MSALNLSVVDFLVIAVILISAGYAIYRGFVQESLSIFAWAAAAFSALYFGPLIVPHLKDSMPGWAALLLGYAGAFLVVLIPLSFLSSRMAQSVRRSPIGTLDRLLGLVFGAVRGLAIVGLVYLLFSMMVPVPVQPAWVTDARLLPLVQNSSELILALIPGQHFTIAGHEFAAPSVAPTARPGRRGATPDIQTAQTKKMIEKTYGASERRALDKLIEVTGSGGKEKP